MGGGDEWRRAKEEKWDNCDRITIQNYLKTTKIIKNQKRRSRPIMRKEKNAHVIDHFTVSKRKNSSQVLPAPCPGLILVHYTCHRQ